VQTEYWDRSDRAHERIDNSAQEAVGELSLDPTDWQRFREAAHLAVDDAVDFIRTVGERPVWQGVPDHVRTALATQAPEEGEPFENVYREFKEFILPFATGNIHPRFFGWVHGSGLANGIIAEMLAATMNSNCGGRDHGAIYVERAVLGWCKQLFGFPAQASGLLVSGSSMANLIGLGVARNSYAGNVRRNGVREHHQRLIAYASSEVHESVVKAMEVLGLGATSLRKLPVEADFRLDIQKLKAAIIHDRQEGLAPFCVVGSAGTVNTGAVDDLDALASLCAAEGLWFHVDGAFGALCILSDTLSARLAGIERADSIAFDFHKWMHVQYDAGCILVREGNRHRAAYSQRPPYLKRFERGLAGGEDWPCEFGLELSRGFRALKIWFALKEHGTAKIGRLIAQNCAQAQYLGQTIARELELELLAPVTLNIVCFRFRKEGLDPESLDQLNENIVADLQESGLAAPSTTWVLGRLAIRVAITNHRSRRADFDLLIHAVLASGRKRISGPVTQTAVR